MSRNQERNERSSRYFQSIAAAVLLLWPLILAVGPASAQRRGERSAPVAISPGEITIDDVCAAAVPRESQGKQFQWSPDGRSIAFFKSFETGFGLRLELDVINVAGQRTVLLNRQQLDALFPAMPSGPEKIMFPPPWKSLGFEWAPDGSGLLLHSDTGIAWLDRKTLQTRSVVKDKGPIGDVQLSPDGRWAGYIRDHNLWVVNLASGISRPLTKGGSPQLLKGELDWMYPKELGTKHGYAWAPDSSHIAYLEFNLKGVASYTPPFTGDDDPSPAIDYPTPGTPNPGVRVFVVGLNDKTPPVAVDTGRETNIYLPRLQWLPDGKQVAVQRLNRLQTSLDLLIVNARTGSSRIALTDNDQYWINLSSILYFFKDSPQFLWSSERSGYRHLFLYGLDGKLVRPITTGEWEVTSLDAVDEDGGKLYYTSTLKSSLERQLYVVNLDGTGTRPISRESGTHESIFAPDAQVYVDDFSTATKPWLRSVYRIAPPSNQTGNAGAPSSKLFALDEPPQDAKKLAFRPLDFINVKTHDGVEMNAMLIRPAGLTAEKKNPAIVYVYGGPGHQAVHDAWDGDVSMWQQFLVQHGYIVYAADNRGSSGRGHLFEEYIHLRFGGQEITDQKDALSFLQTLPYIDPARVGLWGRGFGGALTAHAMIHPPIVFKAGFAIAPVVNWMHYDSAFAERYLGDPVKNQDGYLSSSPLDEWQRYKGPMLIAQGTSDLEVHPDQSMEIQEDLVERRKYVEISLYPGQSHLIDQPDACAVLYQRATDFFAKSL